MTADNQPYVNQTLWDETPTRWHTGWKVIPGGKKKPWWSNRWITHPCHDLAYAYEVGVRAAYVR